MPRTSDRQLAPWARTAPEAASKAGCGVAGSWRSPAQERRQDMSVQIASLQPDQLERNYVCRYDHKSIAMPRGNSANPLTCKPQGRQPLCKPCRQKKGSNCTYLVGEVSRRSVLPTKEIKSLWLDPSVFKNHGHEIKELPLSPLRNRLKRRRPVLTGRKKTKQVSHIAPFPPMTPLNQCISSSADATYAGEADCEGGAATS